MYKIGEVVFDICGLDQKNVSSRLQLFFENEADCDVVYNVRYVRDFNFLKIGSYLYLNSQFFVLENNDHKTFLYVCDNKIHAALEEQNEKNSVLYLSKDYLSNVLHPYLIPSLLGVERLLIKKQSFILHSSCVCFKGRTILFTAPSGGGKSTQAFLWNKYERATIVNGDKNVIGKVNNKWYSYGLPFSGSSSFCLNETHLIKAIIILAKEPKNRLLKVEKKGFINIFSQVTVNPWDKKFCEDAMDLVKQVCEEIPIYFFGCVNNSTAVEVIKNELF